jgi:hypothetical protein
VPTVPGVTELEGPKVELLPLGVEVPVELTAVPPVHGPEVSLHKVHATVPVGARPVALPPTMAESVQLVPTGPVPGPLIDVVKLLGAAALTVKHSLSLWGPASA